MVKVSNTDQRYQRTHARIRQVFEQLVLQYAFQEITVSLIARQAGINRKTFYMHYESTTALMNELVQDVVQEIHASLPLPQDAGGLLSGGMLQRFFRALAPREDLHRRLICSPDYLFAFHLIADGLAQRTAPEPPAGLLPTDAFRRRALTTFLTNGIMPIYRDWLLSGKPIPEQELAEFLERLMQGCLNGLQPDGGTHA